jgi:signal peptidase II
VTDFIYLHINEYYWPAFNVADSAITIGAIIYLSGLLKGKIK